MPTLRPPAALSITLLRMSPAVERQTFRLEPGHAGVEDPGDGWAISDFSRSALAHQRDQLGGEQIELRCRPRWPDATRSAHRS